MSRQGFIRASASICACVLAALAAHPTRAAIVTLDATDAGFITMAGGSAKGDSTVASSAKYNHSVGRELHYATGALGAPLVAMDRKNYFVFDLTAVTTTITSATLKIYAGVYESVDPSEAYHLRQIDDQVGALGDADALGAPGLTPADFDSPADPLVGMAASMYTKIPGSPPPGPPLHGMAVIASVLDGTMISISLTPDGIAFLNSRLGMRVILGGNCPTATPAPGHALPDTPQQPFGFSGTDIPGGDPLSPDLILDVIPAPGAPATFVLAAGALLRRRRAR